MRSVKLPELPPRCEVHSLQPHAHLWHLPGYEKRACPGRFWCPVCKRWADGEKCKPGAKAAGR
jgi:hypothetical protein